MAWCPGAVGAARRSRPTPAYRETSWSRSCQTQTRERQPALATCFRSLLWMMPRWAVPRRVMWRLNTPARTFPRREPWRWAESRSGHAHGVDDRLAAGQRSWERVIECDVIDAQGLPGWGRPRG